jgi:hypothetical protein
MTSFTAAPSWGASLAEVRLKTAGWATRGAGAADAALPNHPPKAAAAVTVRPSVRAYLPNI